MLAIRSRIALPSVELGQGLLGALRRLTRGSPRRVLDRPEIRQLCDTHRALVARLVAEGGAWAGQDAPNGQEAGESLLAGHYRAHPRDLRGHLGMGTRFDVGFAEDRLLRFLGKASHGFRVLGISCAGLEYHWRSDLTRTLEERVAHAGRMMIITESGNRIELEHLVLPTVENGRVVELRGWFAYCQPDGPARMPASWEEISIVRRMQRARPLPLPGRLLCSGATATSGEEMLCALKASWRDRPPPSEAGGGAPPPGAVAASAARVARGEGAVRFSGLGRRLADLFRRSGRSDARKGTDR